MKEFMDRVWSSYLNPFYVRLKTFHSPLVFCLDSTCMMHNLLLHSNKGLIFRTVTVTDSDFIWGSLIHF